MAPRLGRSVVRLGKAVKSNWFLVGIVGSIFFAYLAPWIGAKNGPLVPRITVKILAVSFIFFSSGLTLKSEDLGRSFLQYRVHSFVQLYTMGLIPILMGLFIIPALEHFTNLSPPLLRGFMIVSCMPPPVSSAAILTRASEGNEAAAIFNSAFGSFLGIVVTPMLLLYTVGISSDVPVGNIFISLSGTVVLPLIVGQVLRHFAWLRIEPLNIPFKPMAQCVLLLIIYSAFCDTFESHFEIQTFVLIEVIITVVACLVLFSAVAFVAANRFGYTRKDVICITFCGTHKSLTLGMPMLKIIFENHPQFSLISLPLLMYHPTQIMLGGFMVPAARNWVVSAEGELPKYIGGGGKPRGSISRLSSVSGGPRTSTISPVIGGGGRSLSIGEDFEAVSPTSPGLRRSPSQTKGLHSMDAVFDP